MNQLQLHFHISFFFWKLFWLEPRQKFYKYFKMMLYLKQQCCPPPLFHSLIPIPTKPFLDTSTFVCWSVHCAAVQLDSAEKQPRKRKKKKIIFTTDYFFLSGSLCSCTNTIVHTKKEPSFRWEHQLLIWLICSLREYFDRAQIKQLATSQCTQITLKRISYWKPFENNFSNFPLKTEYNNISNKALKTSCSTFLFL